MTAPPARDATIVTRPDSRTKGRAHNRWAPVLIVAGIVLVAANMRPVIGSLGPVLSNVRADLGLSGTMAGLVTTLPVLCFAVFGVTAPALAARVGMHRLTLVAMLALTAGLVIRVLTDSVAAFVLASLLALAGVGIANVLTPALIKRHFPHRIRLLTGVYATMMQLGMTASSAISVPLARTFGGWRESLGVWAVIAVVAALPWIGMLREGRLQHQHGERVSSRQLLRSRTAWAMVFFFGIQAGYAYAIFGWLPGILQAAGVGDSAAGFDLSIVAAVGVLMSMALPALSTRLGSFRPLIVGLTCCYAIGYGGLLLMPAAAPWLWSILLGVGGGAFPFTLMLVGLRARTGQGTSALSGFAQGLGYLLAGLGPFLLGALHDATGAWTVPIALLLASLVPFLIAGLAASRPRFLEDEVRPQVATKR